LKLIKPMVLEQGQRFTLRDGLLTLGTGVVTKVNTPLSERERLSLVEGRKAREVAEQK
jgi:elongation factor Tu